MEKKYYDFMVGKEVYYEGEVYKVTSAWEYVGVKDSTLWYSLLAEDGSYAEVDSFDCTDLNDCNIIGEDMVAEVAYMLGEDEDVAEEMIYEAWYYIG